MFSPVERLLAFRYLRSRKRDGFISVIAGFSLVGIALGVATLIVVMAVMNGFRYELFQRILGVDGHVAITAVGPGGIPDYEKLTSSLKQEQGVIQSVPMIDAQVMVMTRGNASGALVRGMDEAGLKQKALLSMHIRPEVMKAYQAGDGVIVGYRLAQRLGLHAGLPVESGGGITLVSPAMRSSVLGSVPRMKAYPILSTFDTGMYEYDNGLILMPLQEAQLFFSYPGRVTTIELMVDKPFEAIYYATKLEHILPTGLQALDWQRRHFQITNALKVERNVMFLILSLIIMVAAFNIVSSLIMLVKDKESDIAILRTMGASRGTILKIFFLTGSTIGVVGTLSGVALGLAFSLNIERIREWLQSLTGADLFSAEIYFLSTLPARTEPVEVIQIALMALGLTFIATLYPSFRAARTEPAEALRLAG